MYARCVSLAYRHGGGALVFKVSIIHQLQLPRTFRRSSLLGSGVASSGERFSEGSDSTRTMPPSSSCLSCGATPTLLCRACRSEDISDAGELLPSPTAPPMPVGAGADDAASFTTPPSPSSSPVADSVAAGTPPAPSVAPGEQTEVPPVLLLLSARDGGDGVVSRCCTPSSAGSEDWLSASADGDSSSCSMGGCAIAQILRYRHQPKCCSVGVPRGSTTNIHVV